MEQVHRYFILNKPINMVSQFVSSHAVNLLTSIPFQFPEGTHAVGRLDSNSEGLLILTTNKKVTRLLFQGEKPHERTYLVLVNNKVSEENITRLQNGVELIIENGATYNSACKAEIVADPPFNFNSPYIMIEHLDYTWLRISLTEGKFHQVRKMVKAIGHKVKRLVRVSIENLELGNLQPGEVMELDETNFFSLLGIENTSIK
ncbi:MAG: 23S rRNA pseudouridine synthase [Chitinophagaceae bacterium]|nr:MAG: 23S rRNA pseudouridine synthase [Chitinophagaceae bacterium]